MFGLTLTRNLREAQRHVALHKNDAIFWHERLGAARDEQFKLERELREANREITRLKEAAKPPVVRIDTGQIIEEPDFKLVVGLGIVCAGCAFKNDDGKCREHACLRTQLPSDHPLSDEGPLIWIRKEAA